MRTPDRTLPWSEVPVVSYDFADGAGIGILELTRHTCRWPKGDPLEPGFEYCGAETSESSVYCKVHHHLAFLQRNTYRQVASRRRRSRR